MVSQTFLVYVFQCPATQLDVASSPISVTRRLVWLWSGKPGCSGSLWSVILIFKVIQKKWTSSVLLLLDSLSNSHLLLCTHIGPHVHIHPRTHLPWRSITLHHDTHLHEKKDVKENFWCHVSDNPVSHPTSEHWTDYTHIVFAAGKFHQTALLNAESTCAVLFISHREKGTQMRASKIPQDSVKLFFCVHIFHQLSGCVEGLPKLSFAAETCHWVWTLNSLPVELSRGLRSFRSDMKPVQEAGLLSFQDNFAE